MYSYKSQVLLDNVFHKFGGQLRMSEAIQQGISRYRLYKMRDAGLIQQVSRGIYRLADLPDISQPDLVTVALRYPKSVVCLISALSYHEMTTQIPHEVSVAISRDSRIPVLDNPPIHAYKFSDDSFNAGIDKHQIDGAIVQIYNPEKTLADCFKYRNKLGMDIVLEALKLYRKNKAADMLTVMKYAKICRVANVIKPYLEASL